MNVAATVKGAFAMLGMLFGYMFGGWTLALYVLTAFVIFDYITGFIASAAEGKLNPKVGYIGAAKKVFIFIMVSIAHLASLILNQPLVMDGVTFYYIGTEFLSITKNFGRLGVPVPEVLQKAISDFPTKPIGGTNDGK